MNRSPWHVSADELFGLRGHGGTRFTEFVDALVRAEANASGIASGEVVTNVRVNLGDGGVNTEVRVGALGAAVLDAPACFQYKGTSFLDVTAADLREEVKKPFARERIEKGFRYLACVCDDTTAEKKNERELALAEAVRAINTTAPAPHVLAASDLAEWARCFPAVVVQFFRPFLVAALSIEQWRRKERADFQQFIEVPSRTEITASVRRHVVGQGAGRAALTLAGPSGVGKSRLALEAMDENAAPTVLYVPDGTSAMTVATALVGDPRTECLLVVDRCQRAVQRHLEQLVRGAADRIRVLAIADSTEEQPRDALQLKPLDDQEVLKVLEANFPLVPSVHRRAIARLTDGVLQVAGTLCREYAPGTSFDLDGSARSAHDSLLGLVGDPRDMEALEVLSLVPRVGYSGTPAGELSALCSAFGLLPGDVLARARRLASSPGCISVGERYLSVRPRLYCRALLARTWERRASSDASGFFGCIPAALVPAFLEQVAEHAPPPFRKEVGAWVAPWANRLQPADLARAEPMRRFLALLQVHPERFLPLLRSMISRLSDTELQAPTETLRQWPVRMHLLWSLERLIAVRAFYVDVEEVLFQLALSEGGEDRNKSLSATTLWTTSFRVVLSGTEVPVAERLEVLKKRLDASDGSGPSAALILGALEEILTGRAWRMEHAQHVAGKLRPPDWQPRTYDEWNDVLRKAVRLLGEVLRKESFRQRGLVLVANLGRELLGAGLFDELVVALDAVPLNEDERVALLDVVGEFLEYECTQPPESAPPADYVAKVRKWKETFERADLGGRLVTLLGATSMKRQLDEREAWLADIRSLAEELFEEGAELRRRLGWLGRDAHGPVVFELGHALGKLDDGGALLAEAMLAAQKAENPLFFRGYVTGLVGERPALVERVSRSLDSLELSSPRMAFDLSMMLPGEQAAIARTLRMVREKKLPLDSLKELWRARNNPEAFVDAIDLLLGCEGPERGKAMATALEMLGPLAYGHGPAVITDGLRNALWSVLVGTILQKRRVSITRPGGDPLAGAVLGLPGGVGVAL